MFKKKKEQNEDMKWFNERINTTIKHHKAAMKRKRKLIRELAGLNG